ncbi:AlwI family type II restriction endonuclease [Helicobacter sp.]|uniref:AlwI family type II restriction endonuclease n=1 Tax=Helicobacter sp. TaxID=218 RepID=UPI0019B6FA5C|nr:AlwI family type II restriction endonuclease [Helicobacter sp.]MBD5165237.1 AlwI family type II restriction endonuclease [Helicobacter sp.]
MSKRNAQYKILSFSTTMRNPQRIAAFLKALLPYEERILTHEIIMEIIANWIQNKFYTPNYAKLNFKDILESDEYFTDSQVQEIIDNSPQNHKEAGFSRGWDSRFDTFYKLPMEFGFCFYAMNEPLKISKTGHLLIDAVNENNEAKIANIFLNCMMKYQCNNPFRSVLNANVPLLLLLNTMRLLKEKIGDSKIHILEIPFFLCWKNDDYSALCAYILEFRKLIPSFSYPREIVYDRCLEILNSNNTIRFKISQICNEAVDEYIRKMRITGIISLRGNGRFLDFNTFELPKIEYVIANYSNFKNFIDKKLYFSYMGEIDSTILEIEEVSKPSSQNALKIQTLEKFANQYTKDQIYHELHILTCRLCSKDEVLKFIPESTRFEFLTAIALKQHFSTLEIMPNYSIDDEGLPKCHASGNQPDIVCKDFQSQSIVEVSLICGRGQVHSELLPITRHLKSLIESNKGETLTHFAIFIAPKIFEDSKVYVEFIKFKDGLDIRNFDILEFIHQLKTIAQNQQAFQFL